MVIYRLNQKKRLLEAFIASMGGVLFGYHIAVISGALLVLADHFHLTLFQESFIASSILLGAFIGSFLGGFASDQWGRRKALFLSAILLLIGVASSLFAADYLVFVISRIITGIAVGMFSIATPLYLAEIAQDAHRGAFVSVYQLAIVIGVLTAYIANWIYVPLGLWKEMLAWSIVPACVLMLGYPWLSESPSWRRLREASPSHLRLFKDTTHRYLLLLGCLVSIIQQITGINIVSFYTPKILLSLSSSSTSLGLLVTLGMGIINILATLLTMYLLDKVGRRLLMLLSIVGVTVCLIGLGWITTCSYSFVPHIAGVFLVAYVAFFSLGLGPVTWTLISEIFPLSMRASAMSIAISLNWVINYLVVFSFLHQSAYCGISGTFYMYAILGLISFLYLWKYLPETSGQPLKK